MQVSQTSAPRPAVPTPPRSAGVAALVGFLVVLELASGLMQAWLSPLLPGILRRFDTTTAQLNWVTAVYLLSTAVCVPILSALGDRYGHRRLLTISVASVAVGAVLVAVAPTFGVLLIGRVVEGPIGALLPLELAIVRERAVHVAGRAVGLLVGALGIGGGVGFALSGAVRDHLSLSATLWIPAVVMIVAVPVAALLVPETTVRTTQRIDWVGAALLGLGLVVFLGAVGNGGSWGWSAAPTLGGLTLGVGLIVAWVMFERRTAFPLLDLSLVVTGALRLPLLAGFFYGAELYGSQVAVALFLGLPASTGFGLGLTPGRLGLVLLAFGIAAFVGTSLAPRVAERMGSRIALAIGAATTAAGYLFTVAVHDSGGVFVLWQVLVGLGNGFTLATLAAVVTVRAPADRVGISVGLFNTSRTVGGAVAGAAFAAVMASLVIRLPGTAKPITSEAGFVTVWAICAGLSLVVSGVALTVRERPPRSEA